MDWLADALRWIAETPPYQVAIGFVAIYPILTGIMWTLTSLFFYARNERRPLPPAEHDLPFVSVVVAAYCEEAVIEGTLESLLALDYPSFEIVVVDDGSSDRTVELVRRHLVEGGPVRLVEKRVNEGKAMALNDAIPVTRGEIVVIVDADIRPRPDVLRHMVPTSATVAWPPSPATRRSPTPARCWPRSKRPSSPRSSPCCAARSACGAGSSPSRARSARFASRRWSTSGCSTPTR